MSNQVKISVGLSSLNIDEESEIPPKRIKVRLFSEWLQCSCTSPVFGGEELEWQGNEETPDVSTRKFAQFAALYEADLSSTDNLASLNQNPGIYAVFLDVIAQEDESEIQNPIGFAYVDCSSLVLEGGDVMARNVKILDFDVDLTISTETALIPREELLQLEPILIDIKCVNAYPLLEHECIEDVAPSVYIYGELQLGGGLTRTVLGFPHCQSIDRSDDRLDTAEQSDAQERDGSSSSDEEGEASTGEALQLHRDRETGSATTVGESRLELKLKLCLLPGLIDIAQVKDSFTSETLVLEVHHESVFKRAFHTRNVEGYALALQEEAGAELDNAAASAKNQKGGKGGKAKPSDKKKPPGGKGGKGGTEPAALEVSEPAPITAPDRFLLECISRALRASRQIRPHGTARFRLEHLLSSAQDLLNRFARRRRDGAAVEGDDDVVVAEDMLLEVRIAKPSKPEKWDLPADISLKSALQRAKEEAMSRLDGTLAVTATGAALAEDGAGTATNATLLTKRSSSGPLSSTAGRTRKKTAPLPSKPLPRHEMFLMNNTSVEITAALHRKLLPMMKPVVAIAGTMTGTDTGTVGEGEQDAGDIAAEEGGEGGGADINNADAAEEGLSDTELLRKLAVTPFTRMIVTLQYLDDDTLKSINDGINSINTEALPDIQGTIRSHSFSEAELAAVNDARLDVITGFMIIDDDVRMLVIEGKAAPGCAMQRMFSEFLPRLKANDEKLRILCNPEVLFPSRSYPDFGPDIRRIRVRDKMKKLARRPEVYNRKQVEEICFSAIDSIMTLRRATDLVSTKKLSMYPAAAALNKLELLYGEAITKADMDGTKKEDFIKKALENQRPNSRSKFKAIVNVIRISTPQNVADKDDESSAHRARAPYVPADCRNPEFEEHLRTRPAHRINYLDEQRTLLREAWNDALRRREKRDEEYTQTVRSVLGEQEFERAQSAAAGGGGAPKVYMYSQQSQNFKTKAFNQLRQRVAEDKNATYSFSKNFISQTVCAVDEKEEQKKQQEEEKQQWLTAKGFQYPKPKTTKELITHPQRPSDARIEELHEQFKDSTDVPANAGATEDPQLLALEMGFQTRIKADAKGLFGSLNPPEYQRPFQLKLVGDRKTLPRGKIASSSLERDPKCFRSVHLGGEKQAQIIADAAAAEKQEWKDKVVVDNLSVRIGGFKIRDKALPINRTADILKDPPTRKELIHLRNRKSHRGADWSYDTTPLSLLNTNEPFVSNAAATALVRTVEYDKFVTMKPSPMDSLEASLGQGQLPPEQQAQPKLNSTGGSSSKAATRAKDSKHESGDKGTADHGHATGREKVNTTRPTDFQRYLNPNNYEPKVVTMIAKRKHPSHDPKIAVGPKWESASSRHESK